MTKDEYLKALYKALAGLDEADRMDITDYVREYIEEAGEDQAMQDLGSPEACARQMKADIIAQVPPVPPLPAGKRQGTETPPVHPGQSQTRQEHPGSRDTVRRSRRDLWILVLGILSLPVSVPLAFALVVLLFCLGLLLLMLLLMLVVILAAAVLSVVLLGWRTITLLPADPAGALYVAGAFLAAAVMACLVIACLRWAMTTGLPWIVDRLSGFYRRLKERTVRHA